MMQIGPNPAEEFKNWCSTIPIFTLSVSIFAALLSILLMFQFDFPLYFALNVSLLFSSERVYSVLTFQYLQRGLMDLIFTLFLWMPVAYRTEKDLGTVRYISFFIINNFLIGLLFSALLYGLGLTDSSYFLSKFYLYNYSGLWPLFHCEFFIQCYKTPDQLIMCCCVFPLKYRYLPYTFLLISLFSGQFEIVLIGFLLGVCRKGYLDVYLNMSWTIFSEGIAKKIEGGCCTCCSRTRRFVTVDGRGYLPINNQSNPSYMMRSPNEGNNDRNLNPRELRNYRAFEGEGHRLGN